MQYNNNNKWQLTMRRFFFITNIFNMILELGSPKYTRKNECRQYDIQVLIFFKLICKLKMLKNVLSWYFEIISCNFGACIPFFTLKKVQMEPRQRILPTFVLYQTYWLFKTTVKLLLAYCCSPTYETVQRRKSLIFLGHTTFIDPTILSRK